MLLMGKPSFFVFLLLLHCSMVSLAWTDTNISNDKSALLALESYITSDPYDFLANWSVSSSPCNWTGVTCNTRHGRVHSLNLGSMGLKGTMSPQLGNLSFLVELDLSDNKFYGQIPKELVRLHRLKLFNLSYNDFHGQVLAEIGDLSMIEYLSFRNNSLNGFIPLSLFNLSRLETLDWNFNFFEAVIPLDVGKLERLKILQLRGNKLSGIIPRTISNLSSLEILDLDYNSLSGGIPNEIGDLSQLKILYLAANQLTGSIPSSLFNNSSLQRIVLAINQLSGSLPKNVCFALPKLELFYVHGNELSGEIPSIWHQCKELAQLSLGDNRFNGGKTPNELGNLTKLQLLYLTASNLQGKMASQPRINSALVTAIRMAKISKNIGAGETSRVYHFVHNQDRPDKAYTTERAQRKGKSNACSGKIFVTVPQDHFGPIPAENDPVRNQGVLVGECWEDRLECRQWGVHFPHVSGIAGQSNYGAQSVVLSGGYVDDEDHGEYFLYTGSGGRDLSGNKRTNKSQSFDQKFEKYN